MRDATDITIILDRSGSMEIIRNDTIGGFNSFIDEQKGQPGECAVTLIQFDTQNAQEYVVDAKPLADVQPLTLATFVPRAGTPLYDAMGQAIVKAGERLTAMAEDQRPEKVLFIVITDGEENSSHEYTKARVFEMVSEQEKTYGWHFVYIGANQDAMKAGASVGVHTHASMTYAPTPDSVRSTYASLSRNVVGARAASSPTKAGASLRWTDEQRKRAGGTSRSTPTPTPRPKR